MSSRCWRAAPQGLQVSVFTAHKNGGQLNLGGTVSPRPPLPTCVPGLSVTMGRNLGSCESGKDRYHHSQCHLRPNQKLGFLSASAPIPSSELPQTLAGLPSSPCPLHMRCPGNTFSHWCVLSEPPDFDSKYLKQGFLCLLI